MSAAAGIHALLFAAVQRLALAKARAAAIFLAGSGLLLVALGGVRIAGAIVVLGAAVVLLFLVGRRLAAALLPCAAVSPGTGVAFGICAASVIGATFAMVGAFRGDVIAPAAVLAAVWGARRFRDAAAEIVARAREIARDWNVRVAAAAELAFLFAASLLVRGLGPEQGSDALTRYLPYVKLLAHFHALPAIPEQFPFVLPQAGLTWAALLTFAPIALRGAFLVALAGCAALSARLSRARGWPSAAITLLVASCPLVAGPSLGLQPDAFAWLTILVLATVVTESGVPESARYGFACGALAMLSWCAKYSTAGFAASLVAFAAFRARRRTLKFVATGAGGAALAGAPWLIHAWRMSGNPVFPFASSIFPSPRWRMRIDTAWTGGRAFHPGWRGWLLWPIDMTIHTNRYAEGRPGSFGFALLALVVLAAAGYAASVRSEKAWLVCAAIGAGVMWTRTPLVRYWIPALWLAIPAAAAGARRIAGRVGAGALAAALLAAAAGQIAYGVFHTRESLEGRDVKVFLGRTSESADIDRLPGAAALIALGRIDPWARVWYTGFEAVGEADVVPLAAERWELAFHVPLHDRATLFDDIDSARCRYWAVASGIGDRRNFERLGIARRYWKPGAVVIADPSVTIYRMPTVPAP